MSMIEICGVLVRARPERSAGVSAVLTAMPGVEVHEVTDDGRLVITIERLDDGPMPSESLSALHDVDGVIAASLVYEHSEPDPDSHSEQGREKGPELEQAS